MKFNTFIFLKLFFSYQKKGFIWKQVFLSLDALLAARVVLLGASLPPASGHPWEQTCSHPPAPSLAPAGKASLASKITSPAPLPLPIAPHFCPPLATSPLSSVRARTAAGTARVKHPLLTEKGKQGTDSNLKDIMSGGKKDFAQIWFTWQGPEGLQKITPTWMLLSTQSLHRTMNFPSNQGISVHTKAMQAEGATRNSKTWTKTTPHTFRFSQFTCMFNLRRESAASAEYRLTA